MQFEGLVDACKLGLESKRAGSHGHQEYPHDRTVKMGLTVTAQGSRSELGEYDIEGAVRLLMTEALVETRRMIDRQGFRQGQDHIINYRR